MSRFSKTFCLATLLAVVGGWSAQAELPDLKAPVYSYKIVNTYPHDPKAFTQGLIYMDGVLYESTGLNGRSSLRKVELETGTVLQSVPVEPAFFAEGMTNWGDDLLQLTYRSQVGFIYDRATLRLTRSFSYVGEGWGLTNDGKQLIMSDGTAELRFVDPKSLQETSRITVRDHGAPIADLNELEYVHGEIFANVWHTNMIARISPKTGEVVGWIDMRGLLKSSEITSLEAVLNGIAYDAAKDRLFVTGKLWPKVFEIKVEAGKKR